MKHHFEDCQIGEKAVSQGRTVTESDIVSYAALTGDWNPIHCDAQFMSQHPAGERIAHGLLVLSISSGLLYRMVGYELLPINNIIFSGLEQVRFVGPTKIGDTLTMHGEIVETKDLNDSTGIVIVRIRMLNQHDELVMTARAKFAVPKRASA